MLVERKVQRGFTLIELVIVIAVVAILSAMLLSSVFGATNRSRSARALSEVNTLAQTIGRMRTDTANTSAACLTGLTNLTSSTSPSACGTLPACAPTDFDYPPCWNGPYMPTIQNDPWGTAYIASMNGATVMVTVTSAGPDTQFNTPDDVYASN